jgi:CrcB protein
VEPWVKVLMLTIGGALGVNFRYWIGDWMSRWSSPSFPWATFTINITGSFAIGFLAVLLASWLPHPHVRLLVIVGFLGGYTTFSSYAYESLTLVERGEVGLALAYVTGSVVLGLLAVTLGVTLGRALGSTS